jgi:hypothetical protein
MTIARTPIALALSLLFVATAGHAQLAGVKDGTSNTVLLSERAGSLLPQLGDGSVRNVEPAGASLTTRASVNGNITQTNQATGSLRGTQTAAIGGVNNSPNLSGSISTQGSLTGNLAQLRNNQTSTAPQTTNIGGVEGSLTVGIATLRGNASANITQQNDAVRAEESGVGQTIDIGGAGNGFQGSTLQTNGVVISPNVVQFQRAGTLQQIRSGSVSGGNVTTATTNGLISTTVSQQATGLRGGGEQSLNVGSLVGSQARQVTTSGLLGAALSQETSGGAVQTVDIGSVSNTDAAGTISTQGQVLGRVTQFAGSGTQRLSVGAVRGGTPSEATTRATLTGNVNQSMTSTPSSEQVVSIGSVEGASGRAQTDATVGASIDQRLGIAGGANVQTVQIASAINTSGSVNTRAVVNGAISQNTGGGGTRQTMNLGSAVGTGATVRTDVAITGNLAQLSNQSAATQTILIGGVVGAGSQTPGDQQ